MNLEEISRRKAEAEAQIKDIIAALLNDSGATLDGVRVETIEFLPIGKPRGVTLATVEIRLRVP